MKTNHQRGYKANTPRYKGGTPFLRTSELADVSVGASAQWDPSNGHRGLARSVAGAKKFVNSRFRFHEKAATHRLARSAEDD